MSDQGKFSFEEIFKQNEKRVFYQMHRLGIRDPDGDFYSEGLFAMWQAYKTYEPNKGPMSTYFNFRIRHALVDLIRKKTREEEQKNMYIEKEIASMTSGNRVRTSNAPLPSTDEMPIFDEKMWRDALNSLTVKQRKWVYYFVIRDMPLNEIAEQEGVTVDAVKSWGKAAKRKLRKVLNE